MDILRKEFEEFLPRLERAPIDIDAARAFHVEFHRVMVGPHVELKVMTFERALQHAYEYILALEKLYRSEESIDSTFIVGRSRREQALIWLTLLDGSMEAIQNLSAETEADPPEWLFRKYGEISRMHNARFRLEPLREYNGARSIAS